MHVAIDRHFPRQIAPVDLVRPGCFLDAGYLPQPHDAGRAIGVVAHGSTGKRQTLKICRSIARLGCQTHIDVVGLVVGCAPVAHGLPRNQRAQRAGNAGHRQTQIAGRTGAHVNLNHRLVCLDAGVQVNQTRRGANFVLHQAAQAIQLFQVRALQGKLDLLVTAHRISQPHMRDGDARHLRQALAQYARQIIDAAPPCAAVDQAHINIGVNFALGIASVQRGQCVADFRKLPHDGFNLPRLGFSGFKRRTHRRVKSQ